jgi:putative transposase
VLELNIVCKQNLKHKEIKVMNDTNSLAHTTWNCKYHIVFAPKYRRLVFFGQKRKEIGAILRQLCEWKNVEIVEAEVCPDHIHMLVKIPPKESVSGFIGFLKGKSSLLIYQKYANMKFKYRDRTFWCRGYYVDTVGKNTQKIKEYIANQLKEDKLTEQMTITEVIDPFKN